MVFYYLLLVALVILGSFVIFGDLTNDTFKAQQYEGVLGNMDGVATALLLIGVPLVALQTIQVLHKTK